MFFPLFGKSLRHVNPPATVSPDTLLPPPAAGRPDLLIIVGEHSGDEHAASLVHGLRQLRPDLNLCAIGGPRLAEAGAELLFDLTGHSVVGFIEVLKHYGFFKRLMAETVEWIATHRPRQVLFVDYPGFNLRIANTLRERGLSRQGGGEIGVLYYVSPQIWAWKAKRRFTMARDLDALACLLPFEPACYADTGLKAEFVGHPLVEPGAALSVRHDPAGPLLVLPGSRKQAVSRIFPVLLAGARRYREEGGKLDAILVLYPSETVLEVLRQTLAGFPELVPLVELRLSGGEPVAACGVLTSSGTMSLNCALAGLPGVIAYRAHPLTYWMGRMLLNVKYLGLASLVLNREFYPELIQGAATPERLTRALRDALAPERREAFAAGAVELRRTLSAPPGQSPAEWVVRQAGW